MFKIYWTTEDDAVGHLECEDLAESLNHTQRLRNSGNRFVSMVSENPNQVGKSGVAAVIDGKLPNGDDYTYTKRRNR